MLSWHQGAQSVLRKYHHHQHEPLIQYRMEPWFILFTLYSDTTMIIAHILLCTYRWRVVYLGKWCFELLLPSFQHEAIRPVMSDINKAISPRQLLLTGYLPFFQTILCQP